MELSRHRALPLRAERCSPEADVETCFRAVPKGLGLSSGLGPRVRELGVRGFMV